MRLLSSKLIAPLPSPSEVTRTRLQKQIEAANWPKLVFVRAPAGFGKTTLMGQYYSRLQTEGIAATWLSLDVNDNDPVRFFTYLAAAFKQIDHATADLSPTGHSLFDFNAASGDLVLALTDRMVDYPDRFALFIDEFEHIHNPEILDRLRQVIELLPATAQLVIGSRELSEIGLARFRARGQLLEIGPTDIQLDRKSTRLNSSHIQKSRMPSSA